MKKRGRWALVAGFAAVAVLAAACSDVSDEEPQGGTGTGAAEVPDNSDTTVTLAINAWIGSEANVAVAQKLLEDQLGYTVETVEIDEFAQFPALQSGEVDATLEVWPSGHAKDYRNYIEADAGVVDAGELGVIGQIGWWLPTYLVDENPDLATWEGLQGNESMFATSETGNSGQLLDGDPSFVTFDQAIADNLGLDLKVVYAGSEAAQLTALESAYSNQEPFLFYFWTPHWAQSKYDLTMVELPEVTAECEKAAGGNVDDYACAYPEDVLYKAFNADLETRAPAAFAFLEAMNWTNEDQNEVGVAISGGDPEGKTGVDPEEAAQTWIDANQDVWQPWVDAGLAAQG
jgi:glycine betaine/proline transport system substrate-binding protein